MAECIHSCCPWLLRYGTYSLSSTESKRQLLIEGDSDDELIIYHGEWTKNGTIISEAIFTTSIFQQQWPEQLFINQNVGFDDVPPTLTITDDTTGIASGDVTYTFSFSEDVTAFSKSDIAVSGGSKGTFSGSGDSYTLIVSPAPNAAGIITVDVDAAVATDAAGNSNAAANQATKAFDTAAPSLTITDTTGTASGGVNYTFSFSEDVSGFSKRYCRLRRQQRAFSGSGGHLALIVSPASNATGTITVDVDAAVATDAAGNSNTAASQPRNLIHGNTLSSPMSPMEAAALSSMVKTSTTSAASLSALQVTSTAMVSHRSNRWCLWRTRGGNSYVVFGITTPAPSSSQMSRMEPVAL